MQGKMNCFKTLVTVALVLMIASMPVCATGNMVSTYSSVSPRFNNISAAFVTMGFRMNNMVYCSIDVEPYTNCTGISGIMKLFDSNGNCLDVWSVSDYERPIFQEFSYQGVYGETYTATFEGYAYSNNGTAPDRLELSITDTCK